MPLGVPTISDPVSAAEFAALIAPLGPFEPRPCLAIAVSGGADSLAAAVLTRDWARAQGGDVLALVVDHGLRAESAAEVLLTCARLAAQSIPAEAITLTDLARGPGLAARARLARHAALEAACAARGILHLVFGHHAGDQAETVAMRMLARSAPWGLSGMAALVETAMVRKLRPLLSTPPIRLRATLRARGMAWVEDPSNADPSQQRARLRVLRADPGGIGPATAALVDAAAARGQARAAAEAGWADELAARATIHPEGYAVLSPGAISPEALASLLAMLAGATHLPPLTQIAPLAAAARACTIAGVQLLPAGRLGPGWLLVREPAAIAPAIIAEIGALWDGRFRLLRATDLAGVSIGAWGNAAPRDRAGLPSAVLRGLPVLRRAGRILRPSENLADFVFAPARQAGGGRFFSVAPALRKASGC